MKIRLFFFALVQSELSENSVKGTTPCKFKVRDRVECQALCDTTSYCDVWVFQKDTQVCWAKQRTGWNVRANSNYDSGFKNQGPWFEPNTCFCEGFYYCD